MTKFKIITNNTGDHLQVLEEFSDPNWSIVLRFGKVLVYNRFRDCLTKEEFIKYKVKSEEPTWRNHNFKSKKLELYKSKKLELYNQILNSVVYWERHLKINTLLDKHYNNFILCC